MNINEPRKGGGFVLPFFNAGKKSREPHAGKNSLESTRIPFSGYVTTPVRNAHKWFHLHNKTRNHFVATVAEFAGTTLFLFFAFSGTQVALLATPPNTSNVVGTPSNPSQLLYSSLCFGFSLAVNAWVFFRISGGLFNPAVTIGMCLVGALPYFRGLLLFIAQILGGITAAALVSCLFPGPVTFTTTLAGGTSISRGLFIEMFLTAQLVFTIFMLAAEKHRGTFIAPIGIGLALFIAELTGIYFTGGSVNPARSFGPAVVAHKFPGYHWIYWVGPILGAILASAFYKFIKILEYETANPGQDAAETQAMTNRVSFAEEGMVGQELDASGASRVHGTGNYGPAKEYGTARRPFSDSPAPPHPNDQFAGLNNGAADDRFGNANGEGGSARNKRDSEGTLVENGVRRGSTRPGSSGNSGGVDQRGAGNPRDHHSLLNNNNNNQRIGHGQGQGQGPEVQSEQIYDK
ncbi:Aquaporin-1 [Ciborinia camelliae]|nr:Aquaporin-1 [Ciborinia camelliae]